MKLNEFKETLSNLDKVEFELPNGNKIPAHFHVTEVGEISKKYIDCGGTVRKEKRVSLQLWQSIDFHHRLKAERLIEIINLSQSKLGIENEEIEVEYQSDTINKYGLKFDEGIFQLTQTQTDCLAKDNCGIPTVAKIKTSIKNLVSSSPEATSCTPGSGCC